MSERGDRAVACFGGGFNCTQAVLSTFAPELGLNDQTALRVAGAFGAGVARRGEMCGAVSGALMVIGLKTSSTTPGDDESKEACYNLAGEFVRRFAARNGSSVCRELLGCNLSTPEGYAHAVEKGLFHRICPGLVRESADILDEILVDKDCHRV